MNTNAYYMRNKKNQARECADAKAASLKGDFERKMTNEQKYGTNDQLIIIGEIDRLGGNAPQIIDDEQIQKSYSYGYFERGSRVLVGKFEQGIYSEEEQRKFGMNDYKYGVPEKYLKALKEYPAYSEGRVYQMGINAYDFTLENGMTLEEYINLMSIMYPETKRQEFIKGFLARECELKENKKKGSR